LCLLARLLDGVGQLVGQQAFASSCARVVLARVKVNVRAVGEGLGPNILVHLSGLTAGMYPDVAKVGPKARFHVGAYLVGQGAAAPPLAGEAALKVKAAISLDRRLAVGC